MWRDARKGLLSLGRKNMFHSDTKWIWLNKQEEKDEYASLLARYLLTGGEITISLADRRSG